MVNSYHKMFNCKLKTGYKEKFIAGLHQELKRSVRSETDDIEKVNLKKKRVWKKESKGLSIL